MEREHDRQTITYEIPSRTITGSVPEILEEIDDMMDALQTIRQAVVERAPKPACPPNHPGWRAAVGRTLRKLHLVSL